MAEFFRSYEHKEGFDLEGFHSHDGWYWKRLPDGSVRVQWNGNPPQPGPLAEHIVDAASWASIVASVSAQGETGDTFRRALAFHEREPIEL